MFFYVENIPSKSYLSLLCMFGKKKNFLKISHQFSNAKNNKILYGNNYLTLPVLVFKLQLKIDNNYLTVDYNHFV